MAELKVCGCRLTSIWIPAYQRMSEPSMEYCSLHAAAPDMLEALEHIYCHMQSHPGKFSLHWEARIYNLIEKAKGRT
jgi:hypothetical protein